MNVKTSYLSDILRSKEFAIFCGAGISRNSGLPLANEVKQYILEKLHIDGKDIKEIMTSNLPFEAFMEIISENADISKILEIFEKGEPNTNHIMIARLARNDYLKTIFTTNFDLFIEKALEKEGLKKNKDFEMYCDEEQFSGIDLESIDDKIIRIFKIHGSIDNRESIRTTMRAVASKTLSDKRRNVIRYLFSTGNHKKVLILGYSCSDEFDIIPQIQSIEKNQKEIIFVEHSKEKKEKGDVRIKERKNPFKTFPGERIKCDTDIFIKDLWDYLKKTIEIGEYKLIKSKVDWRPYLDDWAKELKENKGYLKYFIPGLTLYKISNFKRAIKNYEILLEIAKARGDKIKESACYTDLGCAYHGLGNFRKAIEHHEKSLEIAKVIKDKAGEVKYYTNLGNAYRGLGDFKRAFKCHEKSLEIAQTIGDKIGEMKCFINLGHVYCELGDFKRAIVYLLRSLKIAKAIGDKTEESTCYTNLGNAYHKLGDLKKAIGYYEESLKIDKTMGERSGEAKCYINIGGIYYVLQDFEEAIEYYEKSLEINKLIGDKTEEAKCYTNLGKAYGGLRNFRRAIEYFLKAEKIFNEIEQIHYLKMVYNNLALAYKEIENNKKAEDYKRKLSSDIKIL